MKNANDLPKNVREAVLRGIDLDDGGSDSGEHRFTSADTSTKKGTIETAQNAGFSGAEPVFEIPYVATFKFGKPRPLRRALQV